MRTEKVIRLGKKGVPVSGGNPRPRPMKLVLESEEMRSKLLGRAKNLSVEGGRVVESLYTSGFDPNGGGRGERCGRK